MLLKPLIRRWNAHWRYRKVRRLMIKATHAKLASLPPLNVSMLVYGRGITRGPR